MHTPRFSGQPASAGDFVFTTTFSRPMRTSCENVGTVLPSRSVRPKTNRPRAEIFRGYRRRAKQKCARAHISAERSTANPETTSKKLRTHFQQVELFFWLRLGDAHSALRGWRPIPAAPRSHSVLLCSGTEDIPSNYSTANYAVPHQHYKLPLTNNGVYGKQRALSNHFRHKAVENFNTPPPLASTMLSQSPIASTSYCTPSCLRAARNTGCNGT